MNNALKILLIFSSLTSNSIFAKKIPFILSQYIVDAVTKTTKAKKPLNLDFFRCTQYSKRFNCRFRIRGAIEGYYVSSKVDAEYILHLMKLGKYGCRKFSEGITDDVNDIKCDMYNLICNKNKKCEYSY